MTWRRRTATVLAGLATAVGVLLAWPDGPRWAVPLDPARSQPPGAMTGGRAPCNRPHGFSPDGGTVFAVDRLAGSRPAVLRAWDVATGRPGGDIPLPPAVRADTVLRLSPDGRRLLVWNVGTEDEPGERFVFDVAAGRTVCTVTAGGPSTAPVAFLADGRLFWTQVAKGDQFITPGVELFDATTGRRVAAFGDDGTEGSMFVRAAANEPGRLSRLRGVTFAADATTAALLWATREAAGTADVIEIVTLPAGTVVRRETLPAGGRDWLLGRHAVDRRFALLSFDPSKALAATTWPWQSPFWAAITQQTHSFDGPPAAAADEPYVETQSLPGWALTTPRTQPAFVEWITRRLPDGGLRAWTKGRSAARFESDREVVACEVPIRFPLLTGMHPAATLSPDGRWLAGATEAGTLELWDIAPRLLWPWATAAGLLSGGAVAVVGRKRSWRATR